MKLDNPTEADDTVLIAEGITEFVPMLNPNEARQYVQIFDTAGNTIFHGACSRVRIEVLPPKGGGR